MPIFPSRREPKAPAAEPSGLPSKDVQELWFATRRREWRSLCIMPASPGESVLGIAQALAEVGQITRRISIRIINAEGMDLAAIADLVTTMADDAPAPMPSSTAWTSSPARLSAMGPITHSAPAIIAIESVISNPLILPVALAADAVLLAVTLERSELASARHSIELIGRDRLIGTVLIRPR